MAATKLIRKLISSITKKKKPKGKKVYDEPVGPARKKRKMAKAEGTLQGKRVTQEKAPSKKTKAKPMGTAAKKAAGKKA